MIQTVLEKLRVDKKTLIIYIIVYFIWGIIMHNIGDYLKIARFAYWWQVITCYIFYMIPISLLLREYKWYEQYAFGFFFMGILELGGYALGTSIVFENNILVRWFTPYTFALIMTLFFSSYFPIGNWVVHKISKAIT